MFPTILVPSNGWFLVEHPLKMDDLAVPPILGHLHIYNSPLPVASPFLSFVLSESSCLISVLYVFHGSVVLDELNPYLSIFSSAKPPSNFFLAIQPAPCWRGPTSQWPPSTHPRPSHAPNCRKMGILLLFLSGGHKFTVNTMFLTIVIPNLCGFGDG